MSRVTFVVLVALALGAADAGLPDEIRCQTFADGTVYPSSNAESTNHKLQYTKALSEYPVARVRRARTTLKTVIFWFVFITVSKPAPDWKSTAVVNGTLQELKLKDFRGKYLVFFFYPLDL